MPYVDQMVAKVLILNGPNLNLLGLREPEIYGRETLDDVCAMLEAEARALKLTTDFRQTNSEGELVDWIRARARGGRAHLECRRLYPYFYCDIGCAQGAQASDHRGPPVERLPTESFRHVSFVSQAATGVIAGLGSHGYLLALQALARLIDRT